MAQWLCGEFCLLKVKSEGILEEENGGKQGNKGRRLEMSIEAPIGSTL